MTIGIVDTTVIIHLFRKKAAAQAWLKLQTDRLSVTPFTWLEVIYGAPGKNGQAACLAIMEKFEMIHPIQADIEWAMKAMKTYRLSHGVAIMDCLIASICHRLQLPLSTDNVKHFLPILDASLIVKPN
jgi:predicted nucleic acid-binding protein